MNCRTYFTIVKRVSSDINIPFFSPVCSPLVFYYPFICIISNKKDGMVNLCIWFTWKCSPTVVLPIISANSYHNRTCLKHVNDLSIPNIVIRVTSLATVCIFYILFRIATHTLVSFLTLVRDIKFVRNSFLKR